MRTRNVVISAGFLLTVLATGCVETQKPLPPAAPKARVQTKWEKETLEVLESRRVSFCFTGTELSKVVAYLTDLTGLRIKSSTVDGIDPPVTLRVNRMVLRHALSWIATVANVQWGLDIEAEKIYFTPSAEGLVIPENLHAWKRKKRNEYADALEKRRISFFFQDTQLTKVLSFLADLTGLDFVPVLGEGLDPPLTLRVNRMKFGNALDWVATLTGTKYGMRDGAICFQSRKMNLATIPPREWQEHLEETLKERLDVDFRNETVGNVLGFLNEKTELKFLDEIPEDAPRVSLKRKGGTVGEVIDSLAYIFRAGSYASSKEGIRFGLDDMFTVPEWKESMRYTISRTNISLNARNSEFLNMLEYVAQETGLDIIPQLDEDQNPKISFSAEDMTTKDALDKLAALSGTEWLVDRQAVYFVMKPEGKDARKTDWGIKAEDLDRKTAKAHGLRNSYGARIVFVSRRSPAAKAGMKKNDIVLDVDNFRILDAAELRRMTRAPRVLPEPVRIRILRKRTLMVLDLKLD